MAWTKKATQLSFLHEALAGNIHDDDDDDDDDDDHEADDHDAVARIVTITNVFQSEGFRARIVTRRNLRMLRGYKHGKLLVWDPWDFLIALQTRVRERIGTTGRTTKTIRWPDPSSKQYQFPTSRSHIWRLAVKVVAFGLSFGLVVGVCRVSGLKHVDIEAQANLL